MWIAPSRHPEIGNWTDEHWKALTFSSDHDWDTAIEIFEDRIKFRYLDAIEVLQTDDNSHYAEYHQRRFGFAVMALDCLLLETLAQFYEGLKDSDEARITMNLNNTKFYIRFLSQKSFVLKDYFDEEQAGLFYQTVRCGILHQAETKESTIIRYVNVVERSLPFELSADKKGLIVYWTAFHSLVLEEFKAYCDCLRTGLLLIYREKLNTKMDIVCHVARKP